MRFLDSCKSYGAARCCAILFGVVRYGFENLETQVANTVGSVYKKTEILRCGSVWFSKTSKRTVGFSRGVRDPTVRFVAVFRCREFYLAVHCCDIPFGVVRRAFSLNVVFTRCGATPHTKTVQHWLLLHGAHHMRFRTVFTVFLGRLTKQSFVHEHRMSKPCKLAA